MCHKTQQMHKGDGVLIITSEASDKAEWLVISRLPNNYWQEKLQPVLIHI